MKPELSIIIPTYNRATTLMVLLDSLVEAKEELKKVEIVVVDNNSKDSTKKIVETFGKKIKINYVFEKKPGLSIAKNTGYKKAKGTYVTFLDDDAKIDNLWVTRVLKLLRKGHVIFGGKIDPYYELSHPKWFKDIYGARSNGNKNKVLKDDEFLSSTNMVIKKELLDWLGGFDENLGVKGELIGTGEETDLQNKARENNIKINYFPELVVQHLVSDKEMSVLQKLKKAFYSGKMTFKMFTKKETKLKLIALINYLSIQIGIDFVFIAPFLRNKNKYKYTENYLYEETRKKFTLLGSYYGQLISSWK